jgi:hypothetical protein
MHAQDKCQARTPLGNPQSSQWKGRIAGPVRAAVGRAVGAINASLACQFADRARPARLAPRIKVLLTHDRATAVGRQADAAEVIAMQIGHGIGAGVAHGHDLTIEGVVQFRGTSL